jgi:hypothetical protein
VKKMPAFPRKPPGETGEEGRGPEEAAGDHERERPPPLPVGGHGFRRAVTDHLLI